VVFIQQAPAIEIRNGMGGDASMSYTNGLVIQMKMEPVGSPFPLRRGFTLKKAIATICL